MASRITKQEIRASIRETRKLLREIEKSLKGDWPDNVACDANDFLYQAQALADLATDWTFANRS